MVAKAEASTVLKSGRLFEAFVRELHGWLHSVPGVEYQGTPAEIVDEVVSNTDRFVYCDDETIDRLRKCMVMAIHGRWNKLGLMVEKVDLFSTKPLVRVWVVA